MVKKKSSKRRGRSAAFMRSINPYINKGKKIKSRGGQMRRKSRSKKRSYSRKGGFSPMKLLIGSMIYGAAREKVSNLLVPVTSKIPLGEITDEAVLGVISYYAAKKGKGVIKDIGTAGLTIEAARLGEYALSRVSNSNGTTSSGYVFN